VSLRTGEGVSGRNTEHQRSGYPVRVSPAGLAVAIRRFPSLTAPSGPARRPYGMRAGRTYLGIILAVLLTAALTGWALSSGVRRTQRKSMPTFDVFWENDPVYVADRPGGMRLYVYSLPIGYRNCIDRIEPQLESSGWRYNGSTAYYEIDQLFDASSHGTANTICMVPDIQTLSDGTERPERGCVSFQVSIEPERLSLLELIKRLFGL
jgi:hypothetical protein